MSDYVQIKEEMYQEQFRDIFIEVYLKDEIPKANASLKTAQSESEIYDIKNYISALETALIELNTRKTSKKYFI
jgi:hypothetical protein